MPAPEFVIYHNPRCSKSRQALALLRARGAEPHIIEYLKTPPTAAQLEALLAKLRLRPEDVVRKGEDVYKARFKGRAMSDAQWLAALAENPVLLERPIVVKGAKAILARPPERVEELF